MSLTGSGSNDFTYSVPYIDTTGNNFVFSAVDPNDIFSYSEVMEGLYTSSLMAPLSVQTSPFDTWNNTKIPLIDVAIIDGYDGSDVYDSPVDGWYQVEAFNVVDYSSLLGIPMQIPKEATDDNASEGTGSQLTTVFQSAYLTLTGCTPHSNMTKEAIQRRINESGTYMSESPSGTLLMSLKLNGTISNVASATSLAEIQQLPGTLTFSSLIGPYPANDSRNDTLDLLKYSYTSCTLSQTFVDSKVACQYDGDYTYYCSVTHMRASENATALSPLSLFGTADTAAADPIFIDSFINATSISDPGVKSLTERYIYDPGFVRSSPDQAIDLTNIKIPDFEQRLALLLNTFWQAGFGYYSQVTGKVNSTNNGTQFVPGAKFANLTYTQDFESYVPSSQWVGVFLACSIILLLAGLASIYFDARTITPNILGYASSLTRNNKYMDIPKQYKYSTMGGAEQARAMKNVKVMLQDVKPGEPVGKIALGTVSPGTRRLTPSDRVYK
jgi:hypothetical protein